MSVPCGRRDRELLVELVCGLFPPGCFPSPTYERAVDAILDDERTRDRVRAEIERATTDADAEAAVTALRAVLHSTEFVDTVVRAAVRAALDSARSERVAAG